MKKASKLFYGSNINLIPNKKSYLELKIVSNDINELNALIHKYEKLGFISEGFSQDNGELYWTFLRINNGLINE